MSNDNNSERPEHISLLPSINIVGDCILKKGGTLGPRVVPDFELLYFPNGSATVYRVGEEVYTLKEPCFIISRPNVMHEYVYDPALPCRHLFIHFGFNAMPEGGPPFSVLRPNGPSCIPSENELYVGMLKQIFYIAYMFPERLQQRGGALLLALLEELGSQVTDYPQEDRTDRVPPQIAKALDYIKKHLEQPLTVEELANKAGWTHEHFSRSFVRQTGRTPREMIIHRRIEKACQTLLCEDWTVKRIADAVGFTDENYFFRVFRKTKGLTPTQYRKKYFNPSYRDLHPASEEDSLYPLNRILYNAWD
jgi:AraC family transcriptional regulator